MPGRKNQVDLLRVSALQTCSALEQIATETAAALRFSAEKLEMAVNRHRLSREALDAYAIRRMKGK